VPRSRKPYEGPAGDEAAQAGGGGTAEASELQAQEPDGGAGAGAGDGGAGGAEGAVGDEPKPVLGAGLLAAGVAGVLAPPRSAVTATGDEQKKAAQAWVLAQARAKNPVPILPAAAAPVVLPTVLTGMPPGSVLPGIGVVPPPPPAGGVAALPPPLVPLPGGAVPAPLPPGVLPLTPAQVVAAAAALPTAPPPGALAGNRKAREVYVGNLNVGVVNGETVQSLFNAALSSAFPSETTQVGKEGVVSVQMAADGKYAFVEMLTEDMATEALQLNGMDLLGRNLNVARPAGYVDPKRTTALLEQAQAQVRMAQPAPPPPLPAAPEVVPSPRLVLRNLVDPASLNDPEELKEVKLDIEDECGKHGGIVRCVVPGPPNPRAGEAFVEFETKDAALAAKGSLNGRLFDGRRVEAAFLELWPEELSA